VLGLEPCPAGSHHGALGQFLSSYIVHECILSVVDHVHREWTALSKKRESGLKLYGIGFRPFI
jgi:hypothetical protein